MDQGIQVFIQLFIFSVCEAFYCNKLVTQIVALLFKKLFVCCDERIIFLLLQQGMLKEIHIKYEPFILTFYTEHIAYIKPHYNSHDYNEKQSSNLVQQ